MISPGYSATVVYCNVLLNVLHSFVRLETTCTAFSQERFLRRQKFVPTLLLYVLLSKILLPVQRGLPGSLCGLSDLTPPTLR